MYVYVFLKLTNGQTWRVGGQRLKLAKNLKGHFGPSSKNLRAFKFVSGVRFGFYNIFYTLGIEKGQHFQGPFGPLVLTFCGPWPNFRAVGPIALLISTPVDGPNLASELPFENPRTSTWKYHFPHALKSWTWNLQQGHSTFGFPLNWINFQYLPTSYRWHIMVLCSNRCIKNGW